MIGIELGTARLVIDEHHGIVFVEIPRLRELVKALDRFGSLELTDFEQGTVIVTAAATNLCSEGDSYLRHDRPLIRRAI